MGEWLASFLRQEIVSYMETHCSSAAMDTDFRQFINCGWKHYLLKMRKPGEFGDHITLQACAKRFAINILVVSSAGRTHNQLIPGTTTSPVSADDATPTITIGHYTDQVMKGGHYVVLSPRTPTTVRDVMGSMVRNTSRPIQNEENAHPDQPVFGDRPTSAPGDLHMCAETMRLDRSVAETVGKTSSVEMSPVKVVRNDCPTRHDGNGVWCYSDFLKKKTIYPWLLMEQGKLGCEICRTTSSLEVYKTQGFRLARYLRTVQLVRNN